MSRIRKRVEVHTLQSEIVFNACLADPTSCAIIISYSGETDILIRSIKALKANHIPIIVISSIGNNTAKQLADCILHITTREKLYSKIATFSTDTAIIYLLDVIYSCIFALDYDQNLETKINASRIIESGRFSNIDILKESDDINQND